MDGWIDRHTPVGAGLPGLYLGDVISGLSHTGQIGKFMHNSKLPTVCKSACV